MKITRDIQTVSEFKQNASKLVKQINQTKVPVILTINGKPAAVMQDVESYEKMAEAAEYEMTIRALRKALDHVDEGGELVSADEVFARISKKTKIDFEKPIEE